MTHFKRVIEAANEGRRFPVMELVHKEPQLAATISKLVPAIEPPQYGVDGNREPHAPNLAEFRNLSDHTAQNVNDAETVMQVLPEMELAAQILVSSILAPKDMMTTELTFASPEGLMAPDVAAAMIARTKQYFEQVYKIKTKLSDMLRDMLFRTGSYPVAVIPENSVDEAINGPAQPRLESLSEVIGMDGQVKPLGLLGPAVAARPSLESAVPKISLESFSFAVEKPADGRITFESALSKPVDDSFVSVTDNFNVLKVPQLYQRMREQRVLKTVGSRALESLSPVLKPRLNDRELTSLMYRERQFKFKPIGRLKTQEELARSAVGNPLVLHLPSESVIPVYVPGTVEQQVGFFILLDMDGNPVTKAKNQDYYQEMTNRLNSGGNFPSAMLAKVRSQMGGFDLRNPRHIDYSTRVYGNMVEQDLLARLRNGVYSNGVALAKSEDVYRIMLSRALAKQHTQLLFIPVELMTYFALRYDDQGIGKSLLEDMKILNSLRSMLVFGNVMASLKNSIGRTEVKIKLDENDPNPQKTVELAMHEIIRSRQQSFPLGVNSPTDLVDWLQRSAFEFTHEGHPGLPDVAIDFGEKSSNYNKPDPELEELLRKRQLMGLGLNPETVDAGFTAEFATSVVANNLLLAKRVAQIQDQFSPQLNDHLHKAAMNSEELVRDLRDILEENFAKLKTSEKDAKEAVRKSLDAGKAQQADANPDEELSKEVLIDQYLREFLMTFEASLPKPNTVTLENQLEALKKYIDALEITLDAYVSSKFFNNDTGGTAGGYADTIKEVLKAYFVRQWMAENGMLTELSAITTQDGDGNPMVNFMEVQEAHLDALMKSIGSLMGGLAKVKKTEDGKLEKLGVDEASASSSSSSDFAGGEGGGMNEDGSLSDDIGGSDPFADTATGGEGGENTGEPEQQPEDDTTKGDQPTDKPAEGEEKPAAGETPKDEQA